MKPIFWLTICALLLGCPAAQAGQALAASSAPPAGSALPPPDIDDPGVKPQTIPLPDTSLRPSVAPAARQQDANGATSDVAVSTNPNGDSIETYRRNGHVYMVRITPEHGVTRTFHVDSDGDMIRDPNLGPVAPVYYTIFKWGAREPAANDSAPPVRRQVPASGRTSGG